MNLVLAPLAGFTDAPFRRMCVRRGAALTYTEMVSAAAIAHGSKATEHLLEVLPGEGRPVCQLFGSKTDELAAAAGFVSSLGRFSALDLNCGCPVPKVVKTGSGSALINSPEKIYALVAAMKSATDLPVTVKTRPGPRPDAVRMFEILDAVERAGASGITLHARFTSQGHGGAVHLDLLSALVERSKIPVTGNGGVDGAAAVAKMAATGVSAVMIGRAALDNPWIFSGRERCVLDDLELRSVVEEHIEGILELHKMLKADFPDSHIPSEDAMVSVRMHTHLFRYFAGRPGAAEMRRKLNSIRTIAEIRALLQ